jgi:hypothetical protein
MASIVVWSIKSMAGKGEPTNARTVHGLRQLVREPRGPLTPLGPRDRFLSELCSIRDCCRPKLWYSVITKCLVCLTYSALHSSVIAGLKVPCGPFSIIILRRPQARCPWRRAQTTAHFTPDYQYIQHSRAGESTHNSCRMAWANLAEGVRRRGVRRELVADALLDMRPVVPRGGALQKRTPLCQLRVGVDMSVGRVYS